VGILEDDDDQSLHERIKVVERELLVDIVSRLCALGCTVDGRKVTIP
jgi:phosphoribosylglycinamide formyltransferase-1